MNRLTTRLALALCAVAVLAALLGGITTAPLLRGTTEQAVRDQLARQAVVLARLPANAILAERLDRLTERLDLSIGVLAADGTPRGVAEALDSGEREALLAGRAVSTETTYAGEDVLIEARPRADGGAVVVATDASAVDVATNRLRRRVLLAIVVGLVAALGAAALLAGWLGQPLISLAGAARRLAAGERGVPLPQSSLREVADVTSALGGLDAALTESEGRQRAFLLSVSHELRTPLTTVRGYAEGLADGVVRGDEVPEVGRTLVAEAERMERYVGDLLALARMQAADFALDVGPVDVAALLETTAQAWSERARRAGVTVQVEAAAVEMRSDPARLRQVLDVLVDNALRVSAPGDGVVLASQPTPGGVRLEIRDSGPGLSPDDAAVAFEPGALHERYAARRGGQGLGLAIAHRLVTRLGGTIHVEQAPEGGAAFVIDLPTR